jgi:hypothetical protein
MYDVRKILYNELKSYAKEGLNVTEFLTISEDKMVYSLVGVGLNGTKRVTSAGIVARIANDFIIIELDNYHPPFVDDLLQVGIPRDKIILAYQGEEVPEELEVIPQKYLNMPPNPPGAKLVLKDGKLTVETTPT